MKVDEGYLLYHVVTGEMILLTGEMFDEETTQYLFEHWFLVDEDFNEYEMVKALKLMQRETKRVTDGINVYSIFTTTLCNANCFYCYEKNIKQNTMTPQIADASVDFMLENPKRWDATKCDKYFFMKYDWFEEKRKADFEKMVGKKWGDVV